MAREQQTDCTAFEGERCVARGSVAEVALQVKAIIDRGGHDAILIFDDHTSRQVEIDFRGTPDEVKARLATSPDAREPETEPRGPGRPKLGVVAREVTLLPRHWDWLASQQGGASVALRRLVDEARRANLGKDRIRQAQEAVYRFLSVMAGDRPGYEEAIRALYAGDRGQFEDLLGEWPEGIRNHADRLAAGIFDEDRSSEMS